MTCQHCGTVSAESVCPACAIIWRTAPTVLIPPARGASWRDWPIVAPLRRWKRAAAQRGYDLWVIFVTGGRPMTKTQTVRHCGVTLRFVVPNWITRYRAETFATKEPGTLAWIDTFAPGDVLWDIGANVGTYSLYAAARGMRVFAFEPSVMNLECLARNIHLNRPVTIVPIAAAARHRFGPIALSTTEYGGAMASFVAATAAPALSYPTVGLSLPNIVLGLGVPMPDHLKIDVDGIEPQILAGGGAVLQQAQSVLVEVDDGTARGVWGTLTAAGLHLASTDVLDGGYANQVWRR